MRPRPDRRNPARLEVRRPGDVAGRSTLTISDHKA